MKADHRHQLLRLIKRERIHFHGPERTHTGSHQQVFGAIRELREYRFEEYSHAFTHEAHQKPWRARIKRQAERIVRLAEDCCVARQNEFGWRLKLETEILARFGTEVTCKRCSSKLWRSEVEVLLNPSDGFQDLLDLQQRQSNRKPCTCNELQRDRDRHDHGLCRIFHDRADATFKYLDDDSIADMLPAEQRPDRVFGYRETSRFVQLLDQETSNAKFAGQELRDTLECSPYHEPMDQVLFPFLVLEAKCDRGDSFGDVEIQTAFAIKKLLDIQLGLQSAAGERSQWQSGPLCWFLSNRGDEWRIAAAIVEDEGGQTHYHISQLWTGCIRSKDAALQLLLMIDYVFDWARDCQREAILNELRLVAGRDLDSVTHDSDIRSWGDCMQRFLNADSEQLAMEDRAHHRLSALFITEENLNSILLSFTSKQVARKHIRDLLRLLREAWKVSLDVLDELEFMWTGKRRGDDLYGTEQTFCAVFTVAAYFQLDWEHVVELTYIAVSEGVLKDLRDFTNLQQQIEVYPFELPKIRGEHLIGYLRHFRQSSPRAKVLAAMQRTCLSSRLAREEDHPDRFFLISEDRFDKGVRYRMDVTMLPDTTAKSRQITAALYNLCSKGMREPGEDFLRFSTKFDVTTLDGVDLPSIWGPEQHPNGFDGLYIFLARGGELSLPIPDVCACILDDAEGPQAFPLNYDRAASYVTLQIGTLKDRSASKAGWNVGYDVVPHSSTSILSRAIPENQPGTMVYLQGPSSASDRPPNRAPYHATRELPPDMRRKNRTPQGHWVTAAKSANPYDDARIAADYLVARRYNAKLITCLYARTEVAGRPGLRTDERKATPVSKLRGTKEDLQDAKRKYGRDAWKHFKVLNGIQRGDKWTLENRAHREGLLSQSAGTEPQHVEFCAGDWLTDHELNDTMRAGLLGADSDTAVATWENARKRIRLG